MAEEGYFHIRVYVRVEKRVGGKGFGVRGFGGSFCLGTEIGSEFGEDGKRDRGPGFPRLRRIRGMCYFGGEWAMPTGICRGRGPMFDGGFSASEKRERFMEKTNIRAEVGAMGEPAPSPRELVDNLRELINEAEKMIVETASAQVDETVAELRGQLEEK